MINALALTGLATFRVVGKPEVTQVEPISNEKSATGSDPVNGALGLINKDYRTSP